MVSLFGLSKVDRWFEPHLRQTNLKDCQIDMCCFSIKQEALWSKNRYCLARNEDNVSEGNGMFTLGLLFLWASTIKIQLSVLV